MALALATIGDVVPPRERPRYQGYIAATFGVSSVLGPVLGGFFADGPGWEWIFFINVPIGLVALGVTSAALKMPHVRREHEDILRFWFDRGAAGIRIDSAAQLVKDPTLPDVVPAHPGPGEHPHVDRDELHDIYRSWRAVAESYDEPRVLIGEVWLADRARFAQYLRPDEMHTAFNFDFMARPWDAKALRESIQTTLDAHAPVGAPATWVLSNHDVTRPVTRYGREDSSFAFLTKRFGTPTDLATGRRRARAAALLTAALPGSLYVYQGDELGLPEVEDLPLDAIQDPMHRRSGGVDPGRDGCRVPLPWTRGGATFGFGVAIAAACHTPSCAARSMTARSRCSDSAIAFFTASDNFLGKVAESSSASRSQR